MSVQRTPKRLEANNKPRLSRQLGTFSISTEVLRADPDAARTALWGCVVVKAECIFHEDQIIYVAMHEDFDEIEPNGAPTRYYCALHKHADGTVTRFWRKEGEPMPPDPT